MGLSAEQLRTSLDAVAAIEPAVARALGIAGYPEPRLRERGATTMMRAIVGQQVSVAAAASIWNRLEAAMGPGCPAEAVLAADDDALRACGLSRQKASYVRSLAQLVADGDLDFAAMPADDEEAIRHLTAVRGVGRWSAEIYLLFAEGRPDIWPAGDLAVQEAVGRMLALPARPSERETRAVAEAWRPHRGAMAVFAWHAYTVAAL